MKIKKMLFRFLVATVVLAASSVMTNNVQSFGCTQFCANGYNSCMTECNGDSACQHSCWVDWQCCNYLCNGTGSCQ
jgi:hypothetical protein